MLGGNILNCIQKNFKIIIISFLYLLVFAVISGCGQSQQNQSPQQMSAQQQQQFEKEPQKLKDIEAKIEEIVGNRELHADGKYSDAKTDEIDEEVLWTA
jgi:ABC-type Fe3+-citrate transport system substrate-binding protein